MQDILKLKYFSFTSGWTLHNLILIKHGIHQTFKIMLKVILNTHLFIMTNNR